MKLNILVINSRNDFSEKLTSFIGELGHQIDFIESGEAGLDLIVDKKHHLVIVNENLIDTNAQDFIIKASQKKVFCHSAFLLATSNSLDEMNKIRFMSLGFSYFMTTNFDEINLQIVKSSIQDEINMMPMLSAA